MCARSGLASAAFELKEDAVRYAGTPRMSSPASQEAVLIIDFGSQVTFSSPPRAARRGVYSEVVPFQKAEKRSAPSSRRRSSSPAGRPRCRTAAARAPQAVFEAGIPVLGIYYRPDDHGRAAQQPDRWRAACIIASSTRATLRWRAPRTCSTACGTRQGHRVDEPRRPHHRPAPGFR